MSVISGWAQRRQKKARQGTLRARHHSRLVAPQAGDELVSASVGPSGEVVALWAAPEDLSELTVRTTTPGGATFPEPRTSRPVTARVTVHTPDMAIAARIRSLSVAYPTVQPLPDGQVLVVGSRCRWRPEGPDRNAIVYDSDGAVVFGETVGDGIQHVQTTRRGETWVGYFDEGIYGNFGWGDSEGRPPLGASGLTRFSTALTQDWRFSLPDDSAWGSIEDCYALNVDGDTAWACYYDDFPIVRVHDGAVTGWHNDVRGAKALAVGGSRVALYGGYRPDHDRLVVGVLDGDRFQVTGKYRLAGPDGRPLPRTAQVVGRGPDLNVFVDDVWLRLNIDDIPVGSAR
ncbi:hypothetical protein ACFWY9_32465 [Amycolatopsis sp. NPDC059027]|uniref:hypothetical protein n=1 Tax=Amycolatopsis sp. NPDC059027 TaxID=3346709 RepID=UPI003671AB42